ncbi:hypothetical protein D9758_006136 [Tetrapyrgos nigripes]|uniref:F-box domain-containing protein n=1 Tax=Tetrapyrgos nigripes TaxID=182062 RepID=A0A8H5GAU8_9AGAR|nr:hypothetical protein D9758_006136 [Tetrapyrgos nigripes]
MSILNGDTPFKHVLNTNYSASAEESRLISSMLNDSKEVVDALDKDIISLRATMHKCMHRRNKLLSRMDAHRALISPIRRVSAEVMSEIFSHCLSEDHNPVRSIAEAPLLLTRICRSWREIALSDPRLWSAIHIHIPYVHNEKAIVNVVNQRKSGVNDWLGRSGTLPISLSFCATHNDYPCHHTVESSRPPEPAVYEEFMRTLLRREFSSRWRHLDLKFSSAVLNTWLPLKGQGLSSLHTLKLDFGEDFCWSFPPTERTQDFALPDLIREAPNLRVFSLCNYIHNPYNLPIRWQNLTDLTLKSFCHSPEGLTLQQVLYILSQTSQSLQSCALYVSFPIPYIKLSSDQEVVTLPYLRNFEIKFAIYSAQTIGTRISERELGDFFSYLNAPSLKDLGVQVTCGHPNVMRTMSSMPFLNLLRHSGATLSSLNIELPISNESLTECLRLTPNLTSLSMVECRWTRSPMLGIQLDLGPIATLHGHGMNDGEGPVISDDLLKALTPTPETSAPEDALLCPRLEKLKLNKCGPISGGALVRLAKGRWNLGQRGNGSESGAGADGASPSASDSSAAEAPEDVDETPTRLRIMDVSLYVSQPDDIKSVKDAVPQINMLKQQGMKISVSYPQERQRLGRDSPYTGLPNGDTRRHRSPFDRWF